MNEAGVLFRPTEDFIYAIEKLVIKDVVLWVNKKKSAMKQVASKN